MITFPLSVRMKGRTFKNIEHIHPLNQLAVWELLQNLKDCTEVTKVVVFGSSTRHACNPWSDLDVYLEGGVPDKTKFDHHTDAPSLDIIWGSDRIESPNDPLFEVIDREGVVVFER